MQTYEEFCNYSRDYNFSLTQMDVALQYIIDKFKHAILVMGERTSVKSVEAKSQQLKQKGGQPTCAYCTGNHKALDCRKYKTINARKDRIIAQRLCFNYLGVGHSSKTCKNHCVINSLKVTVTVKVVIHHHHCQMERASPLIHVVVAVVHNHNSTHIHHNSNSNNRLITKNL